MDTTSQLTNVDAATVSAIVMSSLIISLVIYIIYGFVLGKVFQKAGRPLWAGFVPIYNCWVLFEIGGKPGWWVLLNFIPFVGQIIFLVMSIIVAIEVAKRFDHSTAFGVIGLWLFSFIGFIILAFDSSKYQANTLSNNTSTPSNPSPTPFSPETTPTANSTEQPPESTPPKKLIQ